MRFSLKRESLSWGWSLGTLTWWAITAWAATASHATAATSATTATASVTALATWATVSLLGVLLKPLGVLGEWGWDVLGSGPEIWGQESVGGANSSEAGLDEVLGGTGAAG